MTVPTKEAIASDFAERWNFPNCVGSIDGKHVVIQASRNSRSLFYNYKGIFSIVLLVVLDARYCFHVVDVGSYGRSSGRWTLANSLFAQTLRDCTLNLPDDTLLPGLECLGHLSHVFVVDEAFPLQRDLMRLFPGSNLSSRNRFSMTAFYVPG